MFTASHGTLPFVDTKEQEIRAKRVHATIHHIDAATSSEHDRPSGPSKHRRLHGLISEGGVDHAEGEVERCGDVGTPGCYDFPSSCLWQIEAEGKSDVTLLPGDQSEVMLLWPRYASLLLTDDYRQKLTFRINEAPSRESLLRSDVFEPYLLAGTLAQARNTNFDPSSHFWTCANGFPSISLVILTRSPKIGL